MSVVVNDIVKMEWDSSRWLQTKGSKKSNKSSAFIFACKEYENSKGELIPVFFDAGSAWIMADEDGIFSFDELKNFARTNYDSSFPEAFEGYHPIVTVDDKNPDMELLTEYGIEGYADDIIARLDDLKPYGEVYETKI